MATFDVGDMAAIPMPRNENAEREREKKKVVRANRKIINYRFAVCAELWVFFGILFSSK